MHPPPTKRRREATLESGHCHGSLWLVQSSSLIKQLQLLGPLGRWRLAHGAVNSMHALVFMTRHVQTAFVWLCFPHISTLLFYYYQTLRGSHVLCSDLVPPRQECSTLWTSSYLSLTISLKECHNWRVVGNGGILGHCFLDFCKSHMHNFLRRFEFKISKRH